MRRGALRLFLGLALALAVGLPRGPAGEIAGATPIRVLFIGNSYIYVNDLPAVLEKFSSSGAGPGIITKAVVHGGWTLKEHLASGEALGVLRGGSWDFVVVQEQSDLGAPFIINGIPRISSDAFFKPSAARWAAEIRKAGARPLFYLTWAKKACPEDQSPLNYAYFTAARDADAVVVPAGMAWEEVRRNRVDLELFMRDGSHPSPAGTYLTACVFYAAIFGLTPVGLPATTDVRGPGPGGRVDLADPSALVNLSTKEALYLQTTAWRTWQGLRGDKGFPHGLPPRAPGAPERPPGRPISAAQLAGTWNGELRLYPSPFLPVEMALVLKQSGARWRGHLVLSFHARERPDESLDLPDLAVSDTEFTFTDPKGLQRLPVRYRGVSVGNGELAGNADADGPPGLYRGTWHLRKAP
jgi:hypothetical protein